MDQDHRAQLEELLAEVRRIEVQSSRVVAGVMAGSYRSVFRGAGIEFDEVREYEAGDDPRSVDWNVTARVGRPYVKKYVDERERTVMFLLDRSASMDGGFGVRSARQTAARVCACLALSAVQNGDRVGLVAFGGEVVKYVPAKRGAAHALRIVRDCLALPAAGTGSDLRPALDFATKVLHRHAIVFLLSDFLAHGWQHALAACARCHDVIAVRLLLPELELPAAGLLRLRDAEGKAQVLVDARSPRVRTAYGDHVARWRARTGELLRRAHVDCMDVGVARDRNESVARPILQFFCMRELRRVHR